MPKERFAKFGPKERDAFLTLLSEGHGRGMAAKQVGVSDRWVQKYSSETKGWEEECRTAEHLADEQVENALFKMACGNNVAAACAWLYNRQPDRWKDRRKPIDETNIPLDVGRLSNAERKNLAAVLDKIIGDQAEEEAASVGRNGSLRH